MLTRKQHELLTYIHQHLSENGVSPSFEEMKEALDLKSKSGVHRLISALEERGFIRRLPNRARALEVMRMPDVKAGIASRPSAPVVSSRSAAWVTHRPYAAAWGVRGSCEAMAQTRVGTMIGRGSPLR